MTNPNSAPAWTPELSPELRDAISAAERAAGEAARIEAALAATRTQLTAAEAELDEARATLAASESGSVLDGGPADRQARKVLIAARDEAEFIAARLAGLEARHQTASVTLIDARRAVAIAWRNWQRAQAAEYIDRVYIPALDQFVTHPRRHRRRHRARPQPPQRHRPPHHTLRSGRPRTQSRQPAPLRLADRPRLRPAVRTPPRDRRYRPPASRRL